MNSTEKIRLYQKKWRQSNRKKCSEYSKRWRERHPEQWLKISRRKRYRIATEKQKQQSLKWYRNNKEKWGAYRAKTISKGNTSKKYRRAHRMESLEILGAKCVRCGFTDVRALQIDHINGGGSVELKGSCTHRQLLLIRKNPEKYQILCANCNWIKRSENHEHA